MDAHFARLVETEAAAWDLYRAANKALKEARDQCPHDMEVQVEDNVLLGSIPYGSRCTKCGLFKGM